MLNHITLMGRLVRNPETRFLQSSTNSVTRFTLAVERDYKAADEERPQTDFINCVAWNKTGEFIEKYFGKGNMIAVTGSLELGSYTNKEGFKVNTAEVKVGNVYFTGEKKAEAADGQAEYSAPRRPEPSTEGDGFMNIPDGIDEELPFN